MSEEIMHPVTQNAAVIAGAGNKAVPIETVKSVMETI